MIDPGDTVIVELPTYSGAIAAFHNLQASLVGVPQDGEGIDIAAVDRVATDLAQAGPACEVHLRHPEFPESRRPADERASGGATYWTPRSGTISSSSKTIPYGSIYFEDVTSLPIPGRSRPTTPTGG